MTPTTRYPGTLTDTPIVRIDDAHHLWLDIDGTCFLRVFDEDGNSKSIPLGYIGDYGDDWGPCECSYPELTGDYSAAFAELRRAYRGERMVARG